MKYEVNEKEFYKVSDFKKVLDFKSSFDHIESTIEFEKYLLKLNINYLDKDDNIKDFNIELPIDLKTSMTELLKANLVNILVNDKEDGIEVVYNLDIIVDEINNDEVIEENVIEQIIKEEKNEDNLMIKAIEEAKNLDFIDTLKTEYTVYKILNLNDENLDKISAKYNMSIEELYEKKRSNSKVIVHDKK